jgi:HTH-type transcriptional regulator/antitoxin HipB
MKSQDIPLVVRRRRKELDLTQSELADLAEVSERLVRDLEGGRLTIGTDKFLAILDALGLENMIVRSQSNQGQSHE